MTEKEACEILSVPPRRAGDLNRNIKRKAVVELTWNRAKEEWEWSHPRFSTYDQQIKPIEPMRSKSM